MPAFAAAISASIAVASKANRWAGRECRSTLGGTPADSDIISPNSDDRDRLNPVRVAARKKKMRRRDLLIFAGALPFGGAVTVGLAEERSGTLEQFAQLESVNARINAIPYVTDDPRFGEPFDTWKFTPDGKSWPCRDYVMAKAEALHDLGWPREVLSVVLCWIEPRGDPPKREYHAVLAVEVSGETWILDNRSPRIYRWDRPPYDYRWALRQVPGTVMFRDVSGANDLRTPPEGGPMSL